MSSNQRLVIPEFLSESLSRVYDGRLQEIMNSLGRMGDRYYFRLNTLAASRWDILAEMRRMHPDVGQHEFLSDAAYLPVRESVLTPKGSFVEADPFAAEAVLHGAHLYAPGVRKCSGMKIGKDASVTDPSGILAGTGVAVRSETSILTNRQGIAVKIENSKYGLPSLMETEPFEKGRIHLQSLPSMVTCLALDPQPNETIVDLNCAPCGKLSYVCHLTDNRARILGFDRNEQKIGRAAWTVERLKCENCKLIAHDSRYAHIDFNLKADRVLVDPPCTALGVTPKLSIRTGSSDITNLSSYQRQFLTAAAALVKVGGTVVYSVCTISLEECEEMSGYAEDELGLEQVATTPRLGHGSTDSYELCQRFDPAFGRNRLFRSQVHQELDQQRGLASSQPFLRRLAEARDAIKNSTLREATIVHHDEADGLTSAALAKIALEQIGLETRLVCLDKLYPEVVNDLEAGSRKVIVYADIGSAHIDLIGKANKSQNLILTLDHHDTLVRDDPLVYNLNPELYDLSGERDASSATVAYLLAKTVSPQLMRHSGLAVIGSMEIPGDPTGLNNLAWEDAVQTQVLTKSTNRIKIKLGEIETSPARASTMLNVLGSVGYYRNGPAMGVEACEHGFSRIILDVARKLEDERKTANKKVMRRLVVEGLFQQEMIQWFHAQDTYEGMSGKVVGSFCSYLRFQGLTDPGKYLIGMMNVAKEIPGWGLLSTSMVKVSGRAPPRLAVQIQKGLKPPLSKIMGESCARVGGFGDGHSVAASGVIPVGRERDLLEALNAMAQDFN